MVELQLLGSEHAAAVLEFERENRAYFSRFISDRGDEYFDAFETRFAESLADEAAGTHAFFVVLDPDGAVLGRCNVFDLPTAPHLGYRVAERAAGTGLASAMVRDLCRRVAATLRLGSLCAAVSDANIASQRVLTRNGFRIIGPAEPSELGGRTGAWYQVDLALRVPTPVATLEE